MPRSYQPDSRVRLCGAGLVIAATLAGAHQAQASEGGASVYLLGSGGPGAAVMPPVKGVFLDNQLYYYGASADAARSFVVGGNVVAGLDVNIVADFATVLWVPTTDLAGGVLGVGMALPVGEPDVKVSALLTGPLGNQVSVSRSDSKLVVGDPILTAMLGWKRDKWHVQASTLVNVPIGHYREDQLANLAFHRWAGDASLAVSWIDEESGWDLTGKAGFTFNGENEHTDYTTGTEFHAEAAVEKKLSPKWSVGLQAYHFEQVSGDSGAGAVLGDFKGRVSGVGATAAYSFVMWKKPATVRLRAFTEFDAKNRPEGDSIWLGLSVPLSMQIPGGAH